MALFKSRKGGDETAATSKTSAKARQPAESIEAMRRRAKHRLIGAAVLVLLGVIGFPLLFDTQPRPVSVDIPIEIPDRNKARPLAPPAQPAAVKSATSQPATSAPTGTGAATAAAPAPAPVTARAPSAPQPREEIITESKPAAATKEDGVKTRSLVDGKPAAAASGAGEGRFVVQVGAFTDVAKARETRLKVEHAGLKTYTQVVETKDGKRIRVRVGPFANKAEADKAADKVKGLDLQPAVLTL